jgi:hypothetical protein
LLVGGEAVAIRPGRPHIRGKVEVASPRSVVLVLRGGTRCRLSRHGWRVGPVVGAQSIRDI